MAEYDKFPKRYKVVRGNGNIIDPCMLLYFTFEGMRRKNKNFIRKIELGLHLSKWMGRISIGEEKEKI